MGEVKVKKDIIQPLWYIKYVSDVAKRNPREFWELCFAIFMPLIITGIIGYILEPYMYVTHYTGFFMVGLIIQFAIFYYIGRVYLLERDLDLDRFSWTSYYCGRIGIEFYRLGNYSNYYHFIDFCNSTLRYWLRFVSWDYRGDQFAKRKLIKRFRKRLKYTSKFAKDNIDKPDKLFEIGEKFLKLGENIASEEEDGINSQYIKDIISLIPEPEKRIIWSPYNILSHKITMGILAILFSFLAIIISYYSLNFELYQSLILGFTVIPAVVIILQLIIGESGK